MWTAHFASPSGKQEFFFGEEEEEEEDTQRGEQAPSSDTNIHGLPVNTYVRLRRMNARGSIDEKYGIRSYARLARHARAYK